MNRIRYAWIDLKIDLARMMFVFGKDIAFCLLRKSLYWRDSMHNLIEQKKAMQKRSGSGIA